MTPEGAALFLTNTATIIHFPAGGSTPRIAVYSIGQTRICASMPNSDETLGGAQPVLSHTHPSRLRLFDDLGWTFVALRAVGHIGGLIQAQRHPHPPDDSEMPPR
jgi:hypothetical protein